ncbi:MAG: PLP-dependent aminotransferase family protein [Acidobacteria bacterium]|nr:PLP-dependent aminotransferase family protein [Acidobacteriota bacterium]MBI3425746.1 PLP-dependent aminotransferase family protein [Acidobacteriota bacterium]
MELAVNLNTSAPQPLHQQLYQELRRSILSGRLSAGQRIPSTRALAKSLGLSRATVTQSYEQLASEGYLQTAIGSGTTVSAQLPDELLQAAPVKPTTTKAARQAKPKAPPQIKLSSYGTSVLAFAPEPAEPDLLFNFRYCRPAVDHFPIEAWRRLLLRHCRAGQHELLDYAAGGQGDPALRAAIAAYLARARAVNCTPDQVIIVNGSQQALHLCAQVLVERGETVAIEEPGYLGARHAFLTHGAQLHPVPVDEAGLQLESLPQTNAKPAAKPAAKLLYVTPSHQFPTGAVLSLPRRLELLAWAEQTGTLILEDDYDSEFRYGGRPIPALQGLAQNANVIYIGTFSKVLFPALRIGYLVVPPALADVFEKAKWLADRHTPVLEQRALCDFITEGYLERHLRRMRTLYDRRRQKLVSALQTQFGERVTIMGANSGIHLMVRLRSKLSDAEVIRRATAAGIGLICARIYYLGACRGDEFVIGYAPLSERRIQEGIKRLAKALL